MSRKTDVLRRSGEARAAASDEAQELLKRKRILTLCSAATLLVISVICYFTLGQKLLLFVEDKDAFKAWLDSFGAGSRFIFVAIRTLQTVIKIIPAEPLEIGAGYVFGTWGGLFWCSLGSLLGSLIILLLTRKFGTKLVSLFVTKERIQSLRFLQDKKNLNTSLFIIYLIPSTPKDIITYLIGLTDESIPLFLLITTIGRIPSILTSTWCGATLRQENYLSAALIFGATAVLGLTSAAIYRKVTAKKNAALSDDEEKPQPPTKAGERNTPVKRPHPPAKNQPAALLPAAALPRLLRGKPAPGQNPISHPF